MKSNRLEAFSDGVIAIIITIMILDLHVPKTWSQNELTGIVPTVLSYVLSYVLVAIYWMNHHHLVHLVQKVDAVTLWSNMNLLFWMSLLPWATACLSKYYNQAPVVALYGAVATACSLAFHLLRRSIARHHRGDEHLMRLHGHLMRKNFVALAIYCISIPLAWISIPLSLLFIALPALMYFMPDKTTESIRRAE